MAPRATLTILKRVACAFVLALSLGCSGAENAAPGDGAESELGEDFRSNDVLPFAGDFLDPMRTLGGLTQFDRLASTLHDDERCAAMTGLAASIVGGRAHFAALLDETERRRDERTDSPRVREDKRVIAEIRSRIESRSLRARDLYEYAEVLYRAFIWPGHGADDDTIGLLVASGGYRSVGKRTERARALIQQMERGDVFPLTADVEGDDTGWHVMLVWKDRQGAVRLYDSDKIGRSHVLEEGSEQFERYLSLPTAVWENRSVFRPKL